jgi:hypothetical protein
MPYRVSSLPGFAQSSFKHLPQRIFSIAWSQWITPRQLEPDNFGLKSAREIIRRLTASA